jgi:hypothetical protein
MDLIERYLAAQDRCAVGRHDGLSAKLRGLLLAHVEAREVALRRPLRADEATAELTGFAHGLLSESRAVIRRLEEACLSAGGGSNGSNAFQGESHGPR